MGMRFRPAHSASAWNCRVVFADEHLPAGADPLRPEMKDAVNPAAHLLVHVTILSAAAQAVHRF